MFKQLLAIAALSFTSQALAGPVYSFTDNNAYTGGPTGDVIDSLSTTWDADNEIFTWNTTFTDSEIDSFWLVVNDKDNPKQVDSNELVIMYGDLTEQKVYTYVYNGANNANSYQSSDLLQIDPLNVVGNSINFTIDATSINAASVAMGSAPNADPYRGLVVGPESIGIWFHVAKGSTVATVDGRIENYAFQQQGWYDRANLALVEVPEPGSMVLMGLGLLGLGAIRKRRATQ